MIDVETRM